MWNDPQPQLQPVADSADPVAEDWARFPTDDGTMDIPQRESAPTTPALTVGTRAPTRRGVLGWLLGLSACAGVALAGAQVTLTRGAPTGHKPAWVVVQMQAAAQRSPEDAGLRQRALDAGDAWLRSGPDGPYRDLIAASHQALQDAP